jgi:uncharacterized protein YndB with AHSA1/START domain
VAERGYLVIADISGYTAFLAGTELEHAQDILADLIETVIKALRPPLALAKLEGDAAFMYAREPRFDGAALLDVVTGCYDRFRRRQRDVKQATTCVCAACKSIPDLNLKICVHEGTWVQHKIAGSEEIVGPDVITAHRLLKNAVAEAHALRGYALFTDAAIAAMKLDAKAAGMIPHAETYEHIGEVKMQLLDLDGAWVRAQERARVKVSEDDAIVTIECRLGAPPALAWSWLTQPETRQVWMHATKVYMEHQSEPRGQGSKVHCVHGSTETLIEILDWRPGEYFTERSASLGGYLATCEISPDGDATRVLYRVQRPKTLFYRLAYGLVKGVMKKRLADGFAKLDAAMRQAG